MPRGPFREKTTVVAAAAAQAIKIGNGLVDVLFFGPYSHFPQISCVLQQIGITNTSFNGAVVCSPRTVLIKPIHA